VEREAHRATRPRQGPRLRHADLAENFPWSSYANGTF
jgi:hypothetical protein